jgi:hypothetical protein
MNTAHELPPGAALIGWMMAALGIEMVGALLVLAARVGGS